MELTIVSMLAVSTLSSVWFNWVEKTLRVLHFVVVSLQPIGTTVVIASSYSYVLGHPEDLFIDPSGRVFDSLLIYPVAQILEKI
ncbi:hypothetical protein CPB83DRAFT_204935 [Crepidotus variabilis]|uniref:Uncharacterized protein n=1 Tax=Crepidotus variabilis TaxID=179855 RepID=A0A9P6JWJ9_9AGAR|nr:hypothetical protein CPB83DRAFT_204935 [Crepidotus variabilis]